MSKLLKPWAQELADDFERIYGSGNCSCHIRPPCLSCMHPGNPLQLECIPNAWGFDFDEEASASMQWINQQIKRDADRHIAEMKTKWGKT
jgi:hypothetical protein